MENEFGIKVIARTREELSVPVEGKAEVNSEEKHDSGMFTFGGKMAGICYMPDNYFDKGIQNIKAADNRAAMVCGSGHHSVFDHSYITFEISNLPKMMAMILNSTEVYTTSEKSSRYTKMHPETELELQIYEKWSDKFFDVITAKYPDIDEKTRHKLALENARYLISVFVPTSMAWTVSYRQLAYVINWLDNLAVSCEREPNDFNIKLAKWCRILSNEFKKNTDGYKDIHDIKDRCLDFMHYQVFNERITEEEHIGDVYQTTYTASFAQVAQLQRHRTIHYEIEYMGNPGEYSIYIPKILETESLRDEFMDDYHKVAYCHPQATLVRVLEQGRAVKFFDKAKERLCGRAQLEIMENTKSMMGKFIEHRDELSDRVRYELAKITNNWETVTKCQMKCITCTESCMWGAKNGLNRLV